MYSYEYGSFERFLGMTKFSAFIDEEDFTQCIREYILPLIPTAVDIHHFNSETSNKKKVSLHTNRLHIDFWPGNNPENYYLRVDLSAELNSTKTFQKVFEKIISTREDAIDFITKTKKNTNRLDHRQYLRGLDAISCQLGICRSLIDRPHHATFLSEVITLLSTWSSKKYEGKNVPFGIVINFNEKTIPTRKISFIDFLKSNYSAVFTDGVFSAVLLDQKGNLCEHKHLFPIRMENTESYQKTLSPTRFCGFAELCDQPHKIGVILLLNGDILLFKNKTLMFAKRRGKWTYFDWARFFNPFFYRYSPADYKIDLKEDKKLGKEILLSKSVYISLLDASFAHNGACLGLSNETGINLQTALKNCNFIKDPDQTIDDTQHKLKLSVLMQLVNYQRDESGIIGSSDKFYDLSDQLITELLSLDGATVIDWEGNIHAAGAIVSIESGTMGGGRTTATKKLSEYGLAFKVSQDGGITGFHNKNEMFKIE